MRFVSKVALKKRSNIATVGNRSREGFRSTAARPNWPQPGPPPLILSPSPSSSPSPLPCSTWRFFYRQTTIGSDQLSRAGGRTDDEDGGVDEVDVLEEGLAGRVRVLKLPSRGKLTAVNENLNTSQRELLKKTSLLEKEREREGERERACLTVKTKLDTMRTSTMRLNATESHARCIRRCSRRNRVSRA